MQNFENCQGVIPRTPVYGTERVRRRQIVFVSQKCINTCLHHRIIRGIYPEASFQGRARGGRGKLPCLELCPATPLLAFNVMIHDHHQFCHFFITFTRRNAFILPEIPTGTSSICEFFGDFLRVECAHRF